MVRLSSENRYLTPSVKLDLREKMVFLSGPRQVGKTTLALGLLSPKGASEQHPAYLNWDYDSDRTVILSGKLPVKQPLVIFDEIHKYSRWRNLVKGYYDKHKSSVSFLVTGSAHLDYYRRGGDSLQGRYHALRLHPFSLREIDKHTTQERLDHLLRFGGFPEPFSRGTELFHRRWQKEQREKVVREDLRDLEQVKDVTLIELLLEHLPQCVGSPLSVGSLKTLLQVAHATAEHWVTILERLYVCYRIAPYGTARIRAVKKEKKLYFYDWSQVLDPGPRFENLVASQLLKYCNFVEDTQGYHMELRFLRDTDKREVDFVVLKDKEPLFGVECKSGERAISPATRYFRARTPIPRFYQVHLGQADFGNEQSDTRVLPFSTFCHELALP